MSDESKLPATEPPLDPVVARLLEDGLAIQDRFIPEPMLKTTGKGHLKSRGVEGLKEDMEELRRKLAKKQAQHASQS